MRGSVYKRCQCPVERNDKGERLACKKAHGSWSYVADAPVGAGKRRQIKKGGFATKKAAEKALAELVDEAAKGTIANDGRLSVEAYLEGLDRDQAAPRDAADDGTLISAAHRRLHRPDDRLHASARGSTRRRRSSAAQGHRERGDGAPGPRDCPVGVRDREAATADQHQSGHRHRSAVGQTA